MEPGSRRFWLGAGLALAGGAAIVLGIRLGRAPAAPGPRPAPPPVDPRAEDGRVAELLVPCVQSGFYDRSLADLVPILVDKLKSGGGEPLKRAKEELGAAGDEGALEVARFFDRYFSDPIADPYLENALDAASLSPTSGAHALLLRALTHPKESVRHRAMMGLASGRARPEDFELFLEQLAGNDTSSLRSLYARALFAADHGRAELEVLRWMRAKEHEDVWRDVALEFGKARAPEVARGCAEVYAALDPKLGVWLAGCAARGGDAGALAFLREEREAEGRERRLAAVRALGEAGLAAEVVPALQDPDEQVRVFAIDGLAADDGPAPEALEPLTGALADSSPVVRGQALKALCRVHDPGALDQALQGLGGGPEPLQESLQALLGPMQADEALARRAQQALLERARAEEHRPIQQRTATLKAMGIVPLREAAAFLRQAALEAEGQTIEHLRAHEWIMIQASNTGSVGRAFLAEELERESDPLRRLDLISAIGSARDDAAREALLLVVEERARSPYEILYAASRVVKIGPARVLAPRLKRASASLEDEQARSAFHCLLWSWY